MSSFLNKNADSLAIVAGIALGIIIVAGYVLGITMIAGSFDQALDPESITAPPPAYDLKGAASLDLKGLDPGR